MWSSALPPGPSPPFWVSSRTPTGTDADAQRKPIVLFEVDLQGCRPPNRFEAGLGQLLIFISSDHCPEAFPAGGPQIRWQHECSVFQGAVPVYKA